MIVNRNARAALLQCIESLKRFPPVVSWEAIVVDNNSSDGSAAAIARQSPETAVIANAENRGLARANNQGLAAARGEAVLISNPDVTFTAGALDALWYAMQRHPRAAFVVPRLLHPDGSLQTSAGDLPRLREAILGRVANRRAAARAQTASGFWWDGWAHDQERTIGHGAEACYLVRMAAVAEIGAQDERFFLDWEGIEWSARAQRHQWEVWFTPLAEVVHVGGASIKQAPVRWVVWSHQSLYRYFRRQSPAVLRPPLAALVTLRAGAKIASVVVGQPLYDRANRG
ncbi:MAG: glycosyltransferase family 2 protein [Candidatus Dormibacteraeota bacterium]|nr:glycosyltransferase family 2 protein [Candidatus Dormibacteraeota bacterium]